LTSRFQYRANANWPRWPAGWQISEVTAVATDSCDRVFVFSRGDHPVAAFDPSGELLFTWEGVPFTRPHGITIGLDDTVYCVDDLDHTVRKFTPEGRLLMTLGTSGIGSDTGSTSIDYRTIQRAGPPFHYPTNLAIAPSGDLFISDGYGNARVHRFSADGKLLHSWGEPGAGPGQFHVPHGIAIDRQGTVYVADRENSRVQLFSPDGEFLTEWTDLARPCEVFIGGDAIYVAELGYRAGMWPGTQPPHPNATGGRVSIFDHDGKLLARFGGGERPTEAGDFFAPHDIWVDTRGSLYVSEVVRSAAKGQRPARGDYHTLQKFERVGD
jgi:DNA-binding beta-propeller fold protein YncE